MTEAIQNIHSYWIKGSYYALQFAGAIEGRSLVESAILNSGFSHFIPKVARQLASLATPANKTSLFINNLLKNFMPSFTTTCFFNPRLISDDEAWLNSKHQVYGM